MKPIAQGFSRGARALVLVLAAAGLLTPDETQGQSADPQEGVPPAASQFRVGQFVRLTAPGIVIDGGVIESVGGDTLFVASEGMQWSVQASLLEAISVRESRVVRYTIVGAVPGALVGVLGKILKNKMDCSSRRTNCPPANLHKGALIGGALGSVIGLIIGKTSTHWRQVFP